MEEEWSPNWDRDLQKLLGAVSVTAMISSTSSGLRFIARKRKTTRTREMDGLGWDDWFSLLATIICFSISWADFGVAIYLTSPSRQHVTKYFTCWTFYATHLCWIFTHWFAALSIIALYSRHFVSNEFGDCRKMRRWITFLRVVATLWTIGAALWTLLGEGLPLSRYCSTGPNERYRARIICTSVAHFAIHFLILITPIFRVRLLPNKLSHKCFLISLYSLGWVTQVFSAIRFFYLIERLYKSDPEIPHYFVMSVMWSLIEIYTCITLINMPTLMPILDWCLDTWAWLHVKKEAVNAGVTRGSAAINSMLLKPTTTKSHLNVSASNVDLENPKWTEYEEVYQLEDQTQRPMELAGEASKLTFKNETA